MTYFLMYNEKYPEDNPQLFTSEEDLQQFIEEEYKHGEDFEDVKVSKFEENLSMSVQINTIFKLEPPF